MFKKKKVVDVPKKVVAKVAPVPVPVEEGAEVEEEQEEVETEEELPEMPSPEPNPLSQDEVLVLAESSFARGMELMRYARTLK